MSKVLSSLSRACLRDASGVVSRSFQTCIRRRPIPGPRQDGWLGDARGGPIGA